MNNQIETIGRFEIYGQWAPELLEAIRPLLRKYESLLPSWCLKAEVTFDAENEARAQCGVDFKYRKCGICVSEEFFRNSIEQRESDFVHELMHANTHQLFCGAMDLLEETLSDNELAFKFAEKQMTEANEGMTTDLTALVVQLTTPTLKQ